MIEYAYVDIFELVDESSLRAPLMIKKAPEAGPRVFLVGGIHGDEVVGLEVIHRVFDNVDLKKGTVYAMPIVNMLGFELVQREVPYDRKDLNRVFPGDASGELSERIAHGIFQFIKKAEPDIVLDIHNDAFNSIPFILIDWVLRSDHSFEKRLEEHADVFGLTHCYDNSREEYLKDDMHHSLTGALVNEARIAALTVELGGGREFNESMVRAGTSGIKNILHRLGMIADDRYEPWVSPTKIAAPYTFMDKPIYTKQKSGVISHRVKPGEFVKGGQLIGVVKDIFGRKREEVLSPDDGYILSLGYSVISYPGSLLAILAVKKER
ncbi:MAG: hypothetical protein A2939_01020 [Parcubacteria group bacterium RIFCSPLOWO2_01_FULL_48_18]|nr:MAG: hypothetical protein A3J67_04905 [Parcubacteria group bacterium RIFCSPHIGHO2_02_FULL_48_10b]OHB22053.1 MAG: hypothetical protein A2939_01020 [Parcubacteria group bacterium RIFCSPLOWO2_01_FULL_48_18]